MAFWFVPIFVRPPSNSDDDPQTQKRALWAVMLGLGLMTMLGGILAVMRSGSTAFPIIGIIIGVILILGMAVALIASLSSQAATQVKKRKRGLDGLDMYSLIDRLVEDLDEDEMAYLRQRLEEKGLGSPAVLPEAIDDLLGQRTEDRRAGRR